MPSIPADRCCIKSAYHSWGSDASLPAHLIGGGQSVNRRCGEPSIAAESNVKTLLTFVKWLNSSFRSSPALCSVMLVFVTASRLPVIEVVDRSMPPARTPNSKPALHPL